MKLAGTDRSRGGTSGPSLVGALLLLYLIPQVTFAASDKAGQPPSMPASPGASTIPAAVPAGPPSTAVAASLAKLLNDAGTTLAIEGQPLPAQAIDDDYAAASYQPIWTDDDGLGPRGATLIDALQSAKAAGMDMVDPMLADISAHAQDKTPDELAKLELLLSGTLLLAISDAGDLAPAALLAASREGDARDFIADHLPATFFYWRLRHALPVYRQYAAAGAWPMVPDGPKLQPGMTDPRVAALGQRLLATGELAQLGPKPELFDDGLAAALRKFQSRHGLDSDGKVGPQTLAALNVPPDRRVQQILVNLERFRRLNRAMGQRYLYVNVAGMELTLVEHGQVTFFNKVIIGRKDRPTPLLQSVIRRIDFNPTWVVPPKIARIDELARLKADPTFFRTHNIRVFDGWGADAKEIDPDSIDWSQYGPSNMPFVLRQDPGPENALGPVKFDFVNDFAVYIHGTPTPALFAFGSRAFSSGCVRDEHPLDLAAYLLRNDPNWPRSRIDDVVRKATTISAPLAEALPVMLTYQTAWVDNDGVVQFRPDIYGLDDSSEVPTVSAPIVPRAAPLPGQNISRKN